MTKKELEKEVIELRNRIIKLESAETIQRELADVDRDIKECQKRLRSIDFKVNLKLSNISTKCDSSIPSEMYSKYAGYIQPLYYTPYGVFNSTQMHNW